ncbi:choice-of-anchor D domain-containing protein [uncultured Desulfuromonas sp.]|uniref:choice-of-anchor D domain-containing protein n=1 Tax=uncultured Desulfuromonas sp. TaxID=181013 RepID=UPI00261DC7A4|nr:choice-of-anchor D domain-containing protein [uncultured Desulfuromonas sp.]
MTTGSPPSASFRCALLWYGLLFVLIWAPGAWAGWSIEQVDTAGDVGHYTSIAIDAQDRAHISYFAADPEDSKKGYLKYAGADAQGVWGIPEVVDGAANSGLHTSLGVDQKIHISYYKENGSQLRYAEKDTEGGTLSNPWDVMVLDAPGLVGLYTSIFVDGQGRSHVSYYNSTEGALKYATNSLDDPQTPEVEWASYTVDGGGSENLGRCSDLAIDSAGVVHISYYDIANQKLRHAYGNLDSWTTQDIDTDGDAGWYSSLVIDSADIVHVSYEAASLGILRHAWKPAGSGSWQSEVVDGSGAVAGHTTIDVDGAGALHISYYSYSDQSHDGDLMYATNASGTWMAEIVDSAEVLDGSNVGQYTSLGLDSSGNPHISYYDATEGDLKYAHRHNPDISASPAEVSFGTVAMGETASATVTVQNSGSGALQVGALALEGHSDFSFGVDDCSGQSVSPGGSCGIEVNFTPQVAGDRSSVLTVASNDPDMPFLSVALSGSSDVFYTLTAASGPGGTVSPDVVTVSAGGGETFTIVPTAPYYIDDVHVDGVSVGALTTYAFSDVQEDHGLEAFFASYVRIAAGLPIYYATVQEAVDAVTSGGEIQTRTSGFAEDLVLGRDITLTLRGGYDADYTGQSTDTMISGSLTVDTGDLTVENIVLQ